MSFFDFLRPKSRRQTIKREEEQTQTNAQAVLTVGSAAGTDLAFSGYVTPDMAMKVATAYACVNVISKAVGSLSLRYERKHDGIFVPFDTHSISYLLDVRPMAAVNAVEWREQLIRDVLLRGNAYIYPRVIDGEVTELVLCHPDSVAHDPYSNTYDIADVMNGVSGHFMEDEIIHIKGMSLDGKTGVSVITFAAVALNISGTGDAETLNRFSSGGAIRGILTNDKRVTGFGEYQDEELEKAAVDLDSEFRRGKWIVSVPGQSELHQLSLSSVDLQFLENKKFGVREICRFFQVPPSFVYDDTSNNYKSAEMAATDFQTNTLNPYLRRIECELNGKLIPRSLYGKRRYVFDRMDIYAMDPGAKAKYMQDTIAAGHYTVNEWRLHENRPPVEGGDRPLVSANLIGLEGIRTTRPDGESS